MAYKLGVLILHGVGSQKPDYAGGMIKKLRSRITKLKFNPDDISWEPAYLADILETKEARLWDNLSADNVMDFKKVRKFIIHNFGDAVAYQRTSISGMDVYTKIHSRIHQHLKRLRISLRKGLSSTDPDKPLVIMAHSLGGYMVSNYIWDIQQSNRTSTARGRRIRREFGGNDFLEMKTLTGIVTFGCNIPLFSLAYEKFEAITFPHKDLPAYFPPNTPRPDIKKAARWLNFYDRDDVLGYPLKPLSPSYRAVVAEDKEINVGKWYKSWNPLSHGGYWKDKDMINPVSDLLAGILKLLGR